MPTFTSKPFDPITVTGGIISAFVAHNSLPSAELPPLIQSVHEALVRIVSGAVTPDAPEPAVAAAAVSVRKSITPDYLVCLDDGLKFKSLRRHLAALGMTPDEYRAKWKLPADYPMVAPNYAAQRSELAKRFGFGQLRGDGVKRKGGRPRKETA
jgi:predicted transcriptional regulator